MRLPVIQNFVDIALPLMRAHAADPHSRASLDRIARAASTVGRPGAPPRSPPVGVRFDRLMQQGVDGERFEPLIGAMRDLAPLLPWRRATEEAGASANFAEDHANAMVLGPGGIEHRQDIWLGFSLLAPGTRYPDHQHSPEETYLVLTPGEFFNEPRGWFRPGVGGSFYNPPNVLHAMRSDPDAPLLALWALWSEREGPA